MRNAFYFHCKCKHFFITHKTFRKKSYKFSENVCNVKKYRQTSELAWRYLS